MDELSSSPMADKPQYVVCKEKDGMFQIILNRPPVNSFDIAMVDEITSIIADQQYRSELKVLVFSAAGKAFSGGFSTEDFSEDRGFQLIEAFGRLFEQLESVTLPIISIVNGPAYGAGCELVIFSDLAIAAESAKLGFPEIRMGLFPALASYLLPLKIHQKRAAELILTGDLLSAKDAERIGLINQAVPDDKLQEQAGIIVGKLLQFSAPVLKLAKQAMSRSHGKPPEEAIRTVEEIYVTELLPLEDSREGIRAFNEKRKPAWKNR
ncbi:MAG TPA: enoyl-CoA hydratase/isomerase family protein [Acidobacteriota bacterium]|nr:enoyl-CoA hydratase/isomerase family protein [Acidobacteriota bacterium]